ncbi:MAG: LacI family DNA-binding transcriptional regulator [Elusimicrobiota bacterium]
MTVTLKDIARIAGVTTATVSKALNNKDDISTEKKQRIIKIAEAKGYSPYIKSRQTGMHAVGSKYIGVVFPVLADDYLVREIQRGIDSVFKGSGFSQIRYNMDDNKQVTDEAAKEMFLEKIIQDRTIVGLMVAFFTVNDATVAKIRKLDISVVQLNSYSTYGNCVTIDNTDASYRAVKTLIGLGRRNIGLIIPEETSENVWKDRLEGYKKAFSEEHITYNPYLIVYEHRFSLEESALATKTLLQREPGIDAILYGSDAQAYGGMEALKELGKNIPDDVAVMGFDNLPFSRITVPPLSSVNQPMFELGIAASKILLGSIEKKNTPHKTLLLKSQLIFRQSTHKDLPKERFT